MQHFEIHSSYLLVLNCANVSLPHGTLLDCYDELGTRYQLPIYVLSSPTNLIDSEQSSVDSRADNQSGASDIDLVALAAADRERDFGDHHSSNSSPLSATTHIGRSTSKSSTSHRTGGNPIVREIKKHRRKQKSHTHANHDSGNESPSAGDRAAAAIPVKFRLSNGKEHRLYCEQHEKMRQIKRRLAMLENGAIDSQTQRFFFGGKQLRK